MDPVTYTASTSIHASSGDRIQIPGFDILTPILDFIGGNSTFSHNSFWGDFISVLGGVWSVYVIAAFIFSIVLLVLYIYATVHKNLYIDLQTQHIRDLEKLWDEQFRDNPRNNRLEDVINHSNSDNPNDWRLAIIEADIILDDLLKSRGFAGNSLGERLKSISPQQMNNLNEAWEAHKVRNKIAHDGADFVLTKRLAQETIGRYRLVFNEFDLI